MNGNWIIGQSQSSQFSLSHGRLTGIFQRLSPMDSQRYRCEIRFAGAYGVLYQLFLLGRAYLHDANQRHGGLALAQVVSDVLAQGFDIARVVQHIVDQLECSTYMTAISGSSLFLLRRGACNDGTHLGGGLE